MKTSYVYLNEYLNGYLYIGSHTWEGPKGELDANYHGSSRVARLYRWTPIKEEILEVVSEDRKLVAEREWIEKYARKYGIADCDALLSSNHHEWMNKFKLHGKVINCHANNAVQCQSKAILPDARRKAILTMRASGKLKEIINKLNLAAHSKESVRRQVNSRIANGTLMHGITAAHSREAMMKAQETRKLNGANERAIKAAATPESRAKAIETRHKNARKVLCIQTGFIGCTPELAKYLNCSVNRASSIIKRAMNNDTSSYNGLDFKFIRK